MVEIAWLLLFGYIALIWALFSEEKEIVMKKGVPDETRIHMGKATAVLSERVCVYQTRGAC